MSKFVKFVGSRVPRMRVHVVVNGNQFRPSGYPAGNGTVIEVSDEEANVLTGVTPPVISEVGRIITGFYVDGNLGEAGLTGEKWIEVTDPMAQSAEEVPEPTPEPKPTKKSKVVVAEPVVEAMPAESVAVSTEQAS